MLRNPHDFPLVTVLHSRIGKHIAGVMRDTYGID